MYTGARYLHRRQNLVVRELTPYGREVLAEAIRRFKHGEKLCSVIDWVKRHRVGAYEEF